MWLYEGVCSNYYSSNHHFHSCTEGGSLFYQRIVSVHAVQITVDTYFPGDNINASEE